MVLLIAAHPGGAHVTEMAAFDEVSKPGENPFGALAATVMASHGGTDEDMKVH